MQAKFMKFLSSTALIVAAPGVAVADVSANDVWTSIQSYVANFGYEVAAGSKEMQGNTLIVRDLNFGFPTPEMSMSATLEKVEFREIGDGTVEITMSPDLPMSMSSTEELEGEFDISLIMRQDGLRMIASGERDAIQYDYVANAVNLDFDKFFIEGEDFDPKISFVMTDLSGNSTISQADVWTVLGMSKAASVDFTMQFEDPNEGTRVDVALNAKSVEGSSEATFPQGIDWQDPAAAFAPGVVSKGVAGTGAVAFTMSVEGSDNFALAYGANGTTFDFDLSDGQISYGGTTNGGSYTFSSADMPFPPINVAIADSAFEFAMPMAQSDTPKDLRLLMDLQGISVDDFLWQMIDAGGQLPRDPANITIDLEGKARAIADLSDPDAMADSMEIPFELNEIAVNEISVSVAGAEVFGTGNFTFDPMDTDALGGVPAPTGSLNVDLYGINALLETLTNMGLLPPDQAMAGRMMLGGFTKPGNSADHLTSTIEVDRGQSIFVNGQQMR